MIAAPWSKGPAQDGGSGIVHDQRYAELTPDGGDLGDGENLELGVGQGFGKIAPGLVIGRLAERLGVGWVDEADFDTHGAQRILEHVPGAAIQIGGAEDIVAGMGDIGYGNKFCRLARAHGETGDTAFERRDTFFQNFGGRVHDPGVDVAEFLQREQFCRMVRTVELV